tara:strand:+ start:1507 stop:1935 length:429 start_codon:yes stop_codon:yes gene_type:complete
MFKQIMSKQIFIKNILFISLIIGISTSLMAANIDNAVTRKASNQIEKLSVTKGKQLWQQKFIGEKPYAERSCTSCHGANVALMGKHIKTNKQIKPMALSSNPKRFTKQAKVDKWFLRNCKWTMGRECTQQEKHDITAYLTSQ